MFRVFFVLTALAVATPAGAVEVYLFRGAGDFSFIQKSLHFSHGLDRIARDLNEQGIYARSTRWENTGGILAEIRRRRPDSVAFIGHSMGALAAMGMARKMRAEGIRVSYLGLIDIPGPVGAVSANVELAENFYHAFPIYGRLTKPRDHPGIVANHYVFGQIHTTMDDSRMIQDAMVSAIWQADARDVRLAAGQGAMAHAYAPPGAAVDTTFTSSVQQFGRRVGSGLSTGIGRLRDLLRP